MSFESDLHRQMVGTWFARLIGKTISILLLSALASVVLLVVLGMSDFAAAAFLPVLLGTLAIWSVWSSASAPMPDPGHYDSE